MKFNETIDDALRVVRILISGYGRATLIETNDGILPHGYRVLLDFLNLHNAASCINTLVQDLSPMMPAVFDDQDVEVLPNSVNRIDPMRTVQVLATITPEFMIWNATENRP